MTDQLILPNLERRVLPYPVNTSSKRKDGPSAKAAVSSRKGKDEKYAHILSLLGSFPMTADEIAEETRWTPLQMRPRCTELRKTVIEPTGEERPSSEGSPMSVLRIKHVYAWLSVDELIAIHYDLLEARR